MTTTGLGPGRTLRVCAWVVSAFPFLVERSLSPFPFQTKKREWGPRGPMPRLKRRCRSDWRRQLMRRQRVSVPHAATAALMAFSARSLFKVPPIIWFDARITQSSLHHDDPDADPSLSCRRPPFSRSFLSPIASFHWGQFVYPIFICSCGLFGGHLEITSLRNFTARLTDHRSIPRSWRYPLAAAHITALCIDVIRDV